MLVRPRTKRHTLDTPLTLPRQLKPCPSHALAVPRYALQGMPYMHYTSSSQSSSRACLALSLRCDMPLNRPAPVPVGVRIIVREPARLLPLVGCPSAPASARDRACHCDHDCD